MENYRIVNGLIYLDKQLKGGELMISKGKIVSELKGKAEIIDAEGCIVSPAFIDIHTHGGHSVDINSADDNQLEELCTFLASRGVGYFNASIVADTRENTLRAIRMYSSFQGEKHEGSRLLGIHLEGPFLNPAHSGAIPREYLREIDRGLLDEYLKAGDGKINYITLAPELTGALELIKEYSPYLTIAIGHSAADYKETLKAVEAGAKSATHLYNAMVPIHQRKPGIAIAALESGIFCEIIGDGRHVHPAMIRIALNTAGYQRIIAITDSMQAAGMGEGIYTLGEKKVIVKGEDALLENGQRAGSVLTMGKALGNLMDFTGAGFEETIPLLTENPARLLGIFDKTASLDIGKQADVILLDNALKVKLTMVQGKIVYKAG